MVFPNRLQKIVACIKSSKRAMVMPSHFKVMYFSYLLRSLIRLQETDITDEEVVLFMRMSSR